MSYLISFPMLVVALAVGGSALVWAQGNAQPAPSASHVVIENCEVFLIDEAKVSADEEGSLVQVEAFEGMEVEEGTFLARLNDDLAKSEKVVAEKEYEAAKMQAGNTNEIELGRKTKLVAEAEYEQVLEANRRVPGTKSMAEVNAKKYTVQKAILQTNQAIFEQGMAKVTAAAKLAASQAADIKIKRRQIVAPINGQVVQMFLHKGEWARLGEPILHLVRLDRLRVQGFADAEKYAPADLAGRLVELNVQLPGGRPATFSGKITFVNPVIAPGGKSFLIHAEVVNRREKDLWVLQPGLRGTLSVDMTQRASQREAGAGALPGPALQKVR